MIFPNFLRSWILTCTINGEATRICHIYSQQLPFTSLLVKEKFGETSKCLKLLWAWLSARFSFIFICQLTTLMVETVIFWMEFNLPFQKNVVDQTWLTFNNKCRQTSVKRSEIYLSSRLNLILSCGLVSLYLD